MKGFDANTIRLLSRSGLVLVFLAMIGSFALAGMSVNQAVSEQSWNDFFAVLFVAVMGIAIYYLALSGFGWIVLRKKNAAA